MTSKNYRIIYSSNCIGTVRRSQIASAVKKLAKTGKRVPRAAPSIAAKSRAAKSAKR